MKQKPKTFPAEKSKLHPRNPHRFRYDFPKLIEAIPELKRYVEVNQFGNESIDFSDANAVKTLNKALLKQFYNIEYWDIPVNYLCPPIPGRADYINYLADLIGNKKANILDIGTGANCVYPIIGAVEYGWSFVGSDIDMVAVKSAKAIVEVNSNIKNKIEIRSQSSPKNIFKGIIQSNDFFDATICNPPFHASLEEAQAGTKRKWNNLKVKGKTSNSLNFGGQSNELWCEGGEEAFILKMIQESVLFAENCNWFTTLVSKSEHLPNIYIALRTIGARNVKTIEMAQGNKISRFVAWTFNA